LILKNCKNTFAFARGTNNVGFADRAIVTLHYACNPSSHGVLEKNLPSFGRATVDLAVGPTSDKLGGSLTQEVIILHRNGEVFRLEEGDLSGTFKCELIKYLDPPQAHILFVDTNSSVRDRVRKSVFRKNGQTSDHFRFHVFGDNLVAFENSNVEVFRTYNQLEAN
jgi:hypothetical protein